MIFFLLEQAPKDWTIEIIGAVVTVLGGLFLYLQSKSKNNSDVEIAKINNDGESQLKELQEAFAKIKSLEQELKNETVRRREAEALRIETEAKLKAEINRRDVSITKLQESFSAMKTMLRIALMQVEAQYKDKPQNSELMGTFKEIHAYLDKDNKF